MTPDRPVAGFRGGYKSRSASTGNRTMKAKQVLLIEDDPRDARSVELAFAEGSDAAPGLEHVETLEAGLDRLRQGGVDAVLLDLDLPGTRGLETLQMVLEAVPDVPVIVLTGLEDEAMGEQALRAGAQDFLVKGSLFGKLLDRSVRYAIERHRILTELRHRSA